MGRNERKGGWQYALTLQWWTDLRNKNEDKDNPKTKGQKAPETEFDKKLKIYDNARKTLDSVKACETAEKALDNVQAERAPSARSLDQAGFQKLAARCSGNSRVLTQLISEEKTMLQKRETEAKAKLALGPPQMQGLGPEGNLRKKKFDKVHQKIKDLNDALKKVPQLTKDRTGDYVTYVENYKKEMELYCKDHPGAKQFHGDYVNTMEGFKKVKDKWGDQKKVTEEMLKIGTQLTRMVNATYIA